MSAIKLSKSLQKKYDELFNFVINSIEKKIGDEEVILKDDTIIVVSTDYGNEDVMKINDYGIVTTTDTIVKFRHLNMQELLEILNYLEECE